MSKAAVIFWSGTGNTEDMANGIVKGMQEAGADVELYEVTKAPSDISGYDKVAFGCPSMGDEVLEESDFEPYFTAAEKQVSGKKIALFGSYGWGDGEWMRNWYARAKEDGAVMMDEGFMVNDAPEEAECVEYGKKFAAF